MKRKKVQDWKIEVMPVLKSKRSEFQLIGYDDITTDEIWHCLEEKVWKGNPEKRLHEIVEDIFHLPASTYMNFITVDAMLGDEEDLLDSIQALTKQNNE